MAIRTSQLHTPPLYAMPYMGLALSNSVLNIYSGIKRKASTFQTTHTPLIPIKLIPFYMPLHPLVESHFPPISI